MIEALRVTFPIALGIAASPVPMIVLLILLMTPGAIPKSYSFLLGWFIGLTLVGILVLHSPGLSTPSGAPSLLAGWIRMGIGSTCLLFSLFIEKDIPKKSVQVNPPGWLMKIESYGLGHALLIGFILSGLNIKNASMVATGAAIIGTFGLDPCHEVVVLILFSAVASLGVLWPHTLLLLFRNRAGVLFAKMKVWLVRNRFLILFIVLIIFGSFSLYRGIVLVNSY